MCLSKLLSRERILPLQKYIDTFSVFHCGSILGLRCHFNLVNIVLVLLEQFIVDFQHIDEIYCYIVASIWSLTYTEYYGIQFQQLFEETCIICIRKPWRSFDRRVTGRIWEFLCWYEYHWCLVKFFSNLIWYILSQNVNNLFGIYKPKTLWNITFDGHLYGLPAHYLQSPYMHR